MSEPGRKLQDVFEHVTDAVERRTANARTPCTSSSFRGDFYFIGPATVNVAPNIAPPSQSGASSDLQEQAAWVAVASSTTSGPFEAFVKRFPSGIFADIARAKIADLQVTKQQAFVTNPAPSPPQPARPDVAQPLATTSSGSIEALLGSWCKVRDGNLPEPSMTIKRAGNGFVVEGLFQNTVSVERRGQSVFVGGGSWSI